MIRKKSTFSDIIHFICYSVSLSYKPWVREMPTALDKKQKNSKQSYGNLELYYILRLYFANVFQVRQMWNSIWRPNTSFLIFSHYTERMDEQEQTEILCQRWLTTPSTLWKLKVSLVPFLPCHWPMETIFQGVHLILFFHI